MSRLGLLARQSRGHREAVLGFQKVAGGHGRTDVQTPGRRRHRRYRLRASCQKYSKYDGGTCAV